MLIIDIRKNLKKFKLSYNNLLGKLVARVIPVLVMKGMRINCF